MKRKLPNAIGWWWYRDEVGQLFAIEVTHNYTGLGFFVFYEVDDHGKQAIEDYAVTHEKYDWVGPVNMIPLTWPELEQKPEQPT